MTQNSKRRPSVTVNIREDLKQLSESLSITSPFYCKNQLCPLHCTERGIHVYKKNIVTPDKVRGSEDGEMSDGSFWEAEPFILVNRRQISGGI